MKKAKVLLLSMLVLATVGGALAFKANKSFNQDYCFLTIDDADGGLCTTGSIQFKVATPQDNPSTFWYSETSNTEECRNNVECATETETFTHE